MRILFTEEAQTISAGVLPIIAGGAIGAGVYAATQTVNNEPITIKGISIATGFGAMTGGLGSAAASAAGGGIVGNAAWRPGLAAINSAGQTIAKNKS
jgi:hypothetical protein